MTYILVKCQWCGKPIAEIEGKLRAYCPDRACRRLNEVDTLAVVGVSSRA